MRPGDYTIFYLVVLHTLYFLFMHYTVSFHRRVPLDENWFRFPFFVSALFVLGIQISAFALTVRKRTVTKHYVQSESPPGE